MSEQQAEDVNKPLSAIEALSQVSKVVRKATLPHLYKSVDFEGRSNVSVRKWTELIMPDYGHLVNKVDYHRSCITQG